MSASAPPPPAAALTNPPVVAKINAQLRENGIALPAPPAAPVITKADRKAEARKQEAEVEAAMADPFFAGLVAKHEEQAKLRAQMEAGVQPAGGSLANMEVTSSDPARNALLDIVVAAKKQADRRKRDEGRRVVLNANYPQTTGEVFLEEWDNSTPFEAFKMELRYRQKDPVTGESKWRRVFGGPLSDYVEVCLALTERVQAPTVKIQLPVQQVVRSFNTADIQCPDLVALYNKDPLTSKRDRSPGARKLKDWMADKILASLAAAK